tara:strand:+ start:213 stop:647 length:435 start_codon:yes stop_codon:yes gene_type:complete
MLVAGLLAASALSVQGSAGPIDCGEGYSMSYTGSSKIAETWYNQATCYTTDYLGGGVDQPFAYFQQPCDIAHDAYQCCIDEVYVYTHCVDAPKAVCTAARDPGNKYQWCPVTTTTTTTALEPAAIAAIAATPLLLIAAAAGTAL